MQLALDAKLEDLQEATFGVIDRLLSNLPHYPSDYCGSDSPNVTGYAGVQVYLVRTSDRIELHVEGREGLVRSVDNRYGDDYPAVLHKTTHLSLRLA